MRPAAPGDVGVALAAVVGADHVLSGEAAGTHAVDGLAPRWAVFPGSLEEVSRCLELAHASGLGVIPSGRGVRLGWGNIPRRADVVLSLRRLDRILDHEPADLTLSVQTGLTLPALNAELRPYGQFVPLDPARATDSTIGGLIATAAGGPYRARYGTMRDLLLGVTVVQPDGTVVKGGGRVVKNVTGYDVAKLHVGGLGTLGVVVEAHLRVHPVPEAEATWIFAFPSAEATLEAAIALRDTPLAPSRLELLDRGTLAALGAAPPPPAALGVTIGSVPDGVRAQGERLREICTRGAGTPMRVDMPEAWWPRVADATFGVNGAADGLPTLSLRIGTRPSDVVKALRAVEAAAAGTGAAVRATAELANGVLHTLLAGGDLSGASRLVGRVRSDLGLLGGTCVVEQAPLSVKRELDVWGDVGPAVEAMRRLKREIDPQGVLNAGRFVGGI